MRYPAEFREWVNNLIRLHYWRKAGYDINREGLGWQEWQALAVISRYFEVKDLEAMVQKAGS